MSRSGHYTPLGVILNPLSFEHPLKLHDWRVASGEKTWPLSKAVRKAVFSRDNHRCYYCGAKSDLSVDHKVPQKIGGSNRSSNLVTACFRCNAAKGAKHLSDFIRDKFHGDAA